MAMVSEQVSEFCSNASYTSEFGDDTQRAKKLSTFDVFLSGAVDEVFKRNTDGVVVDDGASSYFLLDYADESYDAFWQAHPRLLYDITRLRETFSSAERISVHGFSRGDFDEEGDDEPSWNVDCVFIMRVRGKTSGTLNIEKFLGNTKRIYLPMIISAFQNQKQKTRWWQFWSRRK
jgi:hypothetical protein